jgi:hypothetical protein
MSDDPFARSNRAKAVAERLKAEKDAQDQFKAGVKAKVDERTKAAGEAAKPPARYKPNFSIFGM